MSPMSTPPRSPAPAAAPDAPPRLWVRTVRIDEPVDLLGHIPELVTAAWLRHGQGLVAIGTAWSVQTAGPHRFTAAAAAFQSLAGAARVDDEVRSAVSGLLALGSFSYAAASQRPSTLTVPRAVLGVQEGEAFLTLADAEGEPAPPPSWRDLFPSTPRPTGHASDPTGPDIEPDHTPQEYQRLVRQAVAQIREGVAEKVVLSETTTVRTEAPILPAVLLARLAHAYPSTWTYLVDDVIGASPEMLAQTSEGRLFSRVLAGTRSVSDDGELTVEDRRAFQHDAKERLEHAYAVDSVTSRLEDLTTDLTSSPEPFVLRLPGLEHLASDVSAQLRPGVTSVEVAERLHPSAAVSGTPREDADAVIENLEPHDRAGYASPVGWVNARGDGQWAIALRMAHLLDEHTVRLQAGGGLVAASDPVSEHAEVLAKNRPMLRALRGRGDEASTR